VSVTEYFISSTQPVTPQSLQSYSYDRYGNRTISAAQTWGTGINAKQFTANPSTNRLEVPVGQSGVMTYDSAGNLTTDTYSSAGTRTYDAENRMTTAADYTGQTSRYTYNADGKRTRRQVAGSQEEWQIYGFEGELLGHDVGFVARKKNMAIATSSYWLPRLTGFTSRLQPMAQSPLRRVHTRVAASCLGQS
jgi:YD repeat-containing protein